MDLRRDQLSLQYAVKLKSNTSNPAYEAVFNPNFRNFYTSKKSYIRPLSYRIEDHLEAVCCSPVIHHIIPDFPPWHIVQPEIDLSMTSFKKNSVSPHELQSEFKYALSRYPESMIFYSDGSKSDNAVACSFYSSELKLKMRLPDYMSVFTAELIAILSILKCIESIPDEDNFIICSDSLSGIMAIHSRNTKHPYVLEILKLYTTLTQQLKSIVLLWCPAHVGIPGNERADSLAKAALPSSNFAALPVPASDLKFYIRKYITSQWQQRWNDQVHNKLHTIKPAIGPSPLPERESKRGNSTC